MRWNSLALAQLARVQSQNDALSGTVTRPGSATLEQSQKMHCNSHTEFWDRDKHEV